MAIPRPYPSRLSKDRKEIRVVDVFPGTRDSPIQCSLSTRSLVSLPEYNALSYVWGDPDSTTHISVNGLTVQVTKNLEIALRHLRREQGSLLVWIDALCINQKDVEERNHQVAMMGEIYAAASTVMVWIGEADDHSDVAFDLMSEVSSGRVDDPARTEVCSFYLNLASRPWFQRVWVIQELALATHDPMVFCGRESTSWSSFTSAWQVLSLDLFRELGMVGDIADANDGDPKKRIEVLGGIKLDMLDGLRRSLRSPKSGAFGRLYKYSRTSEATEPRDRVYGLLGMLTEEDRAEFTVDYQKPVSFVFTRAMAHIFDKGEGPFFLSGMWLHVGKSHIPDLPSWVPDFSAQTADKTDRPGSTSFWPPSPMSISGAGAGAKNGQVCEDNKTLRVEVLVVDVVKDTVAFDQTIDGCLRQLRLLEDFVTRAHTATVSHTALKPFYERFRSSEQIWSILVSGKRHMSGYDQAPASYSHAYDALLARESQPPEDVDSTDHNEDTVLEYQKGLGSHIPGRVLFSTNNGLIGIGAPDILPGDRVTIWFGAPTASVTRPCAAPQQDKCRLIGAAYVGGIMNGEMVDELYCEDLMNSTTLFVV